MGTIYAGLGARVDLVEMTPDLMPGVDRDLVAVWQKSSAGKFASIMTGTRVTSVEAKPGGIYVRFEGQAAPNAPKTYDLVLVAVGRVANGLDIGGDKAGIKISENGQIPVDSQMRTNVPHIFAIGDIVGGPMLAHKAAHEGHIAAEAAMGHEAHMDAQQIPNVAYTDPEIAWTGKTESQCMAEGLDVEVATFPWMASGRALASSSGTGLTKLIFERETGFLVGGGIVGAHAGELLGEVCLAIEMGSTAEDIAGTIHPHPTLVEGTARAAEIYLKTCTDLPPARSGR
jgi:dihydrolipoamide dehydrogenase